VLVLSWTDNRPTSDGLSRLQQGCSTLLTFFHTSSSFLGLFLTLSSHSPAVAPSLPCPPLASFRRILVRGSMPPCRLRRRTFYHLHSHPPFRKLLFLACFRFLIFNPFFQGGLLTPFAPMPALLSRAFPFHSHFRHESRLLYYIISYQQSVRV